MGEKNRRWGMGFDWRETFLGGGCVGLSVGGSVGL